MSIQIALRFFETVRQQPALQQQLAVLGPAVTTGALAEVAKRAGFPCTAADLQTAFRHDWAMRWLHRPTASAP